MDLKKKECIRDTVGVVTGLVSSTLASTAMGSILCAACPMVGIPATIGCMLIAATVGDKVGTQVDLKARAMLGAILDTDPVSDEDLKRTDIVGLTFDED